MKKQTLNIGLNNNVLFNFDNQAKSICNILNVLEFNGLSANNYQIVVAEYNGSEELTLVCNTYYEGDMFKKVEKLCEIFTQECIPYFSHNDSKGTLVYNLNFLSDIKKFEFEMQYFKM